MSRSCEEIRSDGGRALGISTDVADAAQVERAADRIEHELGPISVWVNNASTTVFARVLDMTAEEYRQVTAVAYLGVVHGTMAALKRMQPRNHGIIIQTGSALAYRSIPLQSAYCAREGGDSRLHRCAALRADPRSLARSLDDGAALRVQHAAVRLGTQQVAAAASTGSTDLSARDRCRSDRAGGDASRAGSLGRLAGSEDDPLGAPVSRSRRSARRSQRVRVADDRRACASRSSGQSLRAGSRRLRCARQVRCARQSSSAQWSLSKHRWNAAALATLLIAGAAVVAAISTSGTRSGPAVRRRSTRTSARPGSG